MDFIRSGSEAVGSRVSGLNPKNLFVQTPREGVDNPEAVFCQKITNERSLAPASVETIARVIEAAKSTNPDVRFQGLLALVILSENDENKIVVVREGGLNPIINGCCGLEQKQQYAAARALWHLAKHDSLKSSVASSEGLRAVSAVSTSLVSHIQYAAARILLHLAESKEIQNNILESDLPARLGDLLCVDAEHVQYVAARTIEHLADTQPSHPSFTDSRVINKLIDLVRVGNDNATDAAIAALRKLIKHEQTREEVMEELVPLLLNTMSQRKSDRVIYVAVSCLTDLKLTEYSLEDKLGNADVMKGLGAMLESDKILIIVAATTFIKGYAHNSKIRDHILESIGFQPFLTLITHTEPALVNAATTILTSLLKDEAACERFLASKGHETLSQLLLSPDTQLQITGLMLLWGVVSARPTDRELITGKSLTQLCELTSESDFTVCFVSALLVARLSFIDNFMDSKGSKTALDSVDSFARGSDWAIVSEVDWTVDDIKSMASLIESDHVEVRFLGVWSLAHLASKVEHRELVAQSGAIQKLNEVSIGTHHDSQEVANQALKIFDSSVVPAPVALGARLDRYVREISEEKETCEKILTDHKRIEQVIKSYDEVALRSDAHLLVSENLSGSINIKLGELKRVRSDIESTHARLKSQLMTLFDDIRSVQNDRDGFDRLSRKLSIKDQLDALNKKIDELRRQIDSENKSLGDNITLKERADVELTETVRLIELKLMSRPKVENRRMETNDKMIDIQYQLDNMPSILAEMNGRKSELDSKLQELLRQLEAKETEILEEKNGLEAIDRELAEWETKLSTYQEAQQTVRRLKDLRNELNKNYGAQLKQLSEYHALLDGVIGIGFGQLEQLGKTQPEIANNTKAFSADDAAANTRYQLEKERALDHELEEVGKELSQGKSGCHQRRLVMVDQLALLNKQRAVIQEEIDRLRAELEELAGKLAAIMSEEALRARLAELQETMTLVEIELNGLDDEIRALEDKKKHQSSEAYSLGGRVRKNETALRRMKAELAEQQAIYNTTYSRLEAELTEFAIIMASYRNNRANIQAKLRPLLAAVSKWQQTVREEKELTIQTAELCEIIVSEVLARKEFLLAATRNPIADTTPIVVKPVVVVAETTVVVAETTTTTTTVEEKPVVAGTTKPETTPAVAETIKPEEPVVAEPTPEPAEAKPETPKPEQQQEEQQQQQEEEKPQPESTTDAVPEQSTEQSATTPEVPEQSTTAAAAEDESKPEAEQGETPQQE